MEKKRNFKFRKLSQKFHLLTELYENIVDCHQNFWTISFGFFNMCYESELLLLKNCANSYDFGKIPFEKEIFGTT